MIKIFQFRGLAVANVLWAGFSALYAFVAGVFYFHEKLSIWEIIGIVLIITGVILVEVMKK